MGEIFKTVFSFEGRLGRKEYWTVQIIMWAAWGLLAFGVGLLDAVLHIQDAESVTLGLFIVAAPVLFASWTTQVKRWHDLNRSGFWMLIVLVPYVGSLYALILLGFVKGDQKANTYGLPVDQQMPNTRHPGADVAGGSFLRPGKEG